MERRGDAGGRGGGRQRGKPREARGFELREGERRGDAVGKEGDGATEVVVDGVGVRRGVGRMAGVSRGRGRRVVGVRMGMQQGVRCGGDGEEAEGEHQHREQSGEHTAGEAGGGGAVAGG